MTGNQRTLLISPLFAVYLIPAVPAAQGNHCIARESPVKMAAEAGQSVYAEKCIACHHADGAGSSDRNPSLIKSEQVNGSKKSLIGLMITGNPAENTAKKKYQQVMPAYRDMTDEDLADVLTYIRRSFGNKTSLVKSSDVKAMRESLR